jgi:hypothetical protein
MANTDCWLHTIPDQRPSPIKGRRGADTNIPFFWFLFSTKVELNQRVHVSDMQAKDVTFQVETGVGACWTRVRQSRWAESVKTTLAAPLLAPLCSFLDVSLAAKLASQQLI